MGEAYVPVSIGGVSDYPGAVAGDWTDAEVELIVQDYFDMLRRELRGESYSKAEHRRRIIKALLGRSEGSIEHKHMNISAVLLLHGYPSIQGYKPLVNFQRKLEQVVLGSITQDPFLLEQKGQALAAVERRISDLADNDPDTLVIDMPTGDSSGPAEQKGYFINWAEREDRNRRIGMLGEQFVVAVEQHRLTASGRSDLSKKVLWAARDLGDGLGYDVLSYSDRGQELYIEVKSTVLGAKAPFYISRNELEFARVTADAYRLYRVHDLNGDPRIYTLHNPIENHCRMIASGFLAVPAFL